MVRPCLVFCLTLGLTFNSFGYGPDKQYYYRVKRHDSASAVLLKCGLKPIYQRKGSLDLLTNNNPKISDIDKIYPKQRLYFPRSLVERARKVGRVEISSKNEIILLSSPTKLSTSSHAPTRSSVDSAAHSPKVSAEKVEALSTPPQKAEISPVEQSLTAESTEDTPLVSADESGVDEVHHYADVFAKYRFTTLRASDLSSSATAELISSRDIEVGASWIQDWNGSIKTYGQFAMRNIAFEPSLQSTKSLESKEKSPFRLSMGLEQKLTDKIKIKYFLNYSQELFLRGASSTVVAVDAVGLPSAGLAGTVDIYSRDSTTLACEIAATQLFSATTSNYSVEPGQSIFAGLFLNKQSKKQILEIGFGYYQKSQATSLVKQTEFGPIGYIRYSIPILKRDPR